MLPEPRDLVYAPELSSYSLPSMSLYSSNSNANAYGIGNGNGYGSQYSENASLADPSIAAFIEHGGITMTGGGLVSEAEAHELLHHQQLHSSEQYQQQ